MAQGTNYTFEVDQPQPTSGSSQSHLSQAHSSQAHLSQADSSQALSEQSSKGQSSKGQSSKGQSSGGQLSLFQNDASSFTEMHIGEARLNETRLDDARLDDARPKAAVNAAQNAETAGSFGSQNIRPTSAHIEQEFSKGSHASYNDEEENVSTGTKFKVIAALAIVGLATYIAYWVQEPVQLPENSLKADVLSSNQAAQTETGNSVGDVATQTPVQNVDVSLYGFEPANLTIDKGTKVVWTNTSSEQQMITGNSTTNAIQTKAFTSPPLNSGETFAFTFNEDATFEYYSSYNTALKAKIVVGNGGENMITGTITDTNNVNTLNTGSPTLSTDLTDTAALNSTNTSSTATDSTTDTTAGSATSTLDSTTSNTSESTGDSEANVAPTANSNAEVSALATDINTSENNTEGLKPAAQEVPKNKDQKLTSSGPEDFIYVALFLGIMYFNRKKLAKFKV